MLAQWHAMAAQHWQSRAHSAGSALQGGVGGRPKDRCIWQRTVDGQEPLADRLPSPQRHEAAAQPRPSDISTACGSAASGCPWAGGAGPALGRTPDCAEPDHEIQHTEAATPPAQASISVSPSCSSSWPSDCMLGASAGQRLRQLETHQRHSPRGGSCQCSTPLICRHCRTSGHLVTHSRWRMQALVMLWPRQSLPATAPNRHRQVCISRQPLLAAAAGAAATAEAAPAMARTLMNAHSRALTAAKRLCDLAERVDVVLGSASSRQVKTAAASTGTISVTQAAVCGPARPCQQLESLEEH